MPSEGRPAARSVKVVITGPTGVGKTTFIRTLSEIRVLTTEQRVGRPTDVSGGEPVAMDFGRLTVADGLPIHLFGAPSREQFDFMWDVLAEGMLGFIVVLDDSRPDSAAEALGMLNYFRDRATVPYVVAVNKITHGNPERSLRRARHTLRIPDSVRVVATDARDRDSAKQALLELLFAASEDAGSVAHAKAG